MSETEEVADDVGVAIDATPPTNVELLRGHLAGNGLSRALLDSWSMADTGNAHASLLAAVENFFKPKEQPDDQGAAQ